MKKESAESKHSASPRKRAKKISAPPPYPHQSLPSKDIHNQAEKEIMEIEERYERLTDNADEAIFRVSTDGGEVLNINPAAERIFGYSMQEYRSDPSLSFKTIHPDYKEKQKQIIEEINTTKKTVKNVVLGWIAKDGHLVFMEYTVIPIVNKDGKIIYFESIGRDITERKLAEEKLEKYKILFSKINDLAYICDEKGNILYLNEAFEGLSGHKVKEYIGKSFAPLFDAENLEIAVDNYTRTLKGESTKFEITFKDTGIICEYKNHPLKDEEGNITGVLGIGRDITERKQAEKEKELLVKFPAENPNPVLRIKNNGMVQYANQASKPILEAFQCSVGQVLPDKWKKLIKDIYRSNKSRNIELENKYEIYSATITPFKDTDFLYVYCHDITERKKSSQELGRIEWLLKKSTKTTRKTDEFYEQPYGDLSKSNTSGVIRNMVGKDILVNVAGDYLDLLDSSGAIYEKDGKYALGIFTSGWCQFLDMAARNLCGTKDNAKALNSGKWLCHESCWSNASKPCIEKGQPVDIECKGGIHIYAVPIIAGGEVIGSMNFGYGDPPQDSLKLREIAEKYRVNLDELHQQAEQYESRPQFIIDIAKNRLLTSAMLVGEIIERKQAEKEQKTLLYDMGERVKELTCMYGVAKSIRERQTLEEVFHDVVNLIPTGWQYPEITCGRIHFKDKDYLSKNFKKTTWKLAGDIVVKGKRQGTVEVYYTKKRPQLDEGPYLIEERSLIEGIARALSEAIERKEAEEELDKYHKQLEELVKDRTAKLTKTNNLLKKEVAERKQAENKLQEETKLKRVLLDNMPCIALLLRPKTREIVASNDEAVKVGAVPGERCFATWGQRSDPCPWCLAPEVWATGKTKHIEIEGVGKVWNASWIPITEDLYLHYAFDITEQKQIQRKIEELNTNLEKRVQEELEKSRQKDFIMIQQSRFAAMGEMIMYITHQWGQPLWALQLLLYNLNESINNMGIQKEDTDDLIADGLEMIKKMFTTMNDFKNFFQTNKEKVIFSINKNIKNTLSLVGSSFKHSKTSVIFNEKEELTALGFPNEYSQVILNILKNSKDAIIENGIKGEINIDFLYEGGSAIVRIKDNGGGIPDDILDKIFDSYFTTKTEDKGTGIGLYMSKVIICDHMNGRIKVQNINDGAEFSIITPIVP